MNLEPFDNAWKNLPEHEIQRTTVNVSRAALSDITRVHGQQGVLQTTIYILLTKLVDELKRNGLTEYDPAAYKLGVANCTITLGLSGRSPAIVPAAGQQPDGTAETLSGNDGPRVPRLAREVPGPAPTSDVNSSSKRTGNRRGKRTQGKEGSSASEPK